MPTVRVALVGFGNVGQALADLLDQRADVLYRQYHLDISVTGIATARHGTIIAPDGVDLARTVAAIEDDPTARLPGALAGDIAVPAFIATVPADIIVELSPLVAESGQPAIRHCETALRNGKHVVTANKGPVAYGYRRLRDLARGQHLQFRFESAVMDGAPIFSLVEKALPATNVRGFRGVINSTTNLVLTMMAAGKTAAEAVAEAQRLGVAEADPSDDLDGWDATVKVCALMNALMDADVRPANIERTGIGGITVGDISAAAKAGAAIKLVAEAWQSRDGTPHGRVAPQSLPLTDPLATLAGTSNMLILRTDTMGDLAIGEYDAGTAQTAYGVLADILHIAGAGERSGGAT
ncbi:MAG: homoserine dehydrogenase [Thermomicrobiales bacterium]